jgi:hypothetical protein
VRDKDFDRQLHDRLTLAEKDKHAAVELATAKAKAELQVTVSARDTELAALRAKLDASVNQQTLAVAEAVRAKQDELQELRLKVSAAEAEHKLSVSVAVAAVEKQRDDFARKLESKDTEQRLLESTLKQAHSAEVKSKDELIAYYKDFKAKLSTKMVGETLEQHCEIEFNRIRAAAF